MLYLLMVTLALANGEECSCSATCSSSDSSRGDDFCSSVDAKLNQLESMCNKSSSHGSFPPYIPISCKDIEVNWPNSPSGYYNIVNDVGQVMLAYCHMEKLCDSSGPWTRVAYLNMTSPFQTCPGNLREYGANGIRVCGRPTSNTGSCSSVYFHVSSEPYSSVCGRVTGYQYATTSAVDAGTSRSIDTYYVDGVSLTYGTPRNHVWTFMTGLLDNTPSPSQYICPCGPGSSQTPPSFIGDNYFCEAGNPTSQHARILHTSDPLWDGQNCGTNEGPCCSVSGIPWFHRQFSSSTTEYLELRICADQDTNDEDAPIGHYEIYVQ